MLVLSRKLDETVVIDGGIKIRIVEIKGSRVRLAVDTTVGAIIHPEEASPDDISLKLDEIIVIESEVKVRIIKIKGNSVRLGIDAPRDARIYREEVLRTIEAENRTAAKWDLANIEKTFTRVPANKE